jgi:hypothetical protein
VLGYAISELTSIRNSGAEAKWLLGSLQSVSNQLIQL